METLQSKKIYTMQDWKRDVELSPQLFQKVEHDIYSDMYCVLPPLPLEQVTEKILEKQLGVKFIQSFCVGEAYTTDDDDPESYLYKSFAKTVNDKCIYLGLRHAEYDVQIKQIFYKAIF